MTHHALSIPPSRVLGLLLTGALSIPACSVGIEGQSELDEVKGAVIESVLWEDRLIPVCWEKHKGYEQEKEWMRRAVERTWDTYSALNFVGWGDCTLNSRGIRIRIDDHAHPHVKAFGRQLDGLRDGVVLSARWLHPSFADCGSSETMRRMCTTAAAVHEFGHALGFAHEQAREDTPEWCNDQLGYAESDPEVWGDLGQPVGTGTWDDRSVMNYCNQVWVNGGYLSTGDIHTVATAYGSAHCPGRHKVVVNRSGGTYEVPYGNGQEVDLPPYETSDEDWAWTLDCVRKAFQPFDVAIDDAPPPTGSYIEVAVSGDLSPTNASRPVTGIRRPCQGQLNPDETIVAHVEGFAHHRALTCSRIAYAVGAGLGLPDLKSVCPNAMALNGECGATAYDGIPRIDDQVWKCVGDECVCSELDSSPRSGYSNPYQRLLDSVGRSYCQ